MIGTNYSNAWIDGERSTGIDLEILQSPDHAWPGKNLLGFALMQVRNIALLDYKGIHEGGHEVEESR